MFCDLNNGAIDGDFYCVEQMMKGLRGVSSIIRKKQQNITIKQHINPTVPFHQVHFHLNKKLIFRNSCFLQTNLRNN
ncbi:unnamed protein product [Leptidea sinapis]|uniref:Uncharacterized protein n=1 Tax=Leptidea sinapis TaxID=189913 RepID=A0A5E4Q0Z8_9NEOP|nr:unnamed protein product [Leptidea sinapis]